MVVRSFIRPRAKWKTTASESKMETMAKDFEMNRRAVVRRRRRRRLCYDSRKQQQRGREVGGSVTRDETLSARLAFSSHTKYEFKDNVSMLPLLLPLPLPQSIRYFSLAIFPSILGHCFIGWLVVRSCVYVHFWLNVNDNIELLLVEVLCSVPLVTALLGTHTHGRTHAFTGLINFSAPIFLYLCRPVVGATTLRCVSEAERVWRIRAHQLIPAKMLGTTIAYSPESRRKKIRKQIHFVANCHRQLKRKTLCCWMVEGGGVLHPKSEWRRRRKRLETNVAQYFNFYRKIPITNH